MTPRSKIIERSMRCFSRGGFSFVPLFGIVFALGALGDFYAAVTQREERWNPAGRRLYGGMILALLGFFLNFAAIAFGCLVLFRSIANA
jgi:hypothetical protein